jgi:hypothetical protein
VAAMISVLIASCFWVGHLGWLCRATIVCGRIAFRCPPNQAIAEPCRSLLSAQAKMLLIRAIRSGSPRRGCRKNGSFGFARGGGFRACLGTGRNGMVRKFRLGPHCACALTPA